MVCTTIIWALAEYKQAIKASIVDKRTACRDFAGFPLEKIDEHFRTRQEKLELMAVLGLLIATEAKIRRDYWTRRLWANAI
jgi:hypothetical protein